MFSKIENGHLFINLQESDFLYCFQRRPENVEEMFEHLSKAKTCKSLLKKHLSKDVYEKLKEKKTSHEATLGDCIISGKAFIL